MLSVSKSPRGQLKLWWHWTMGNNGTDQHQLINALLTISATMQCGPNVKSALGNFQVKFIKERFPMNFAEQW